MSDGENVDPELLGFLLGDPLNAQDHMADASTFPPLGITTSPPDGPSFSNSTSVTTSDPFVSWRF